MQWCVEIKQKQRTMFSELVVFRTAQLHQNCWLYAIDYFITQYNSLRCVVSTTRVLGNSGKTLHPRNVGFTGFHEINFQIICENKSWSGYFAWIYYPLQGDQICEDLESWTCEDLEYWTYEDLESWTCEDMKYWTCEALESGTCEIVCPDSRNSWVMGGRIRESDESQVKDVTSKSPGSACELVADL
jgi:hypothetical protein